MLRKAVKQGAIFASYPIAYALAGRPPKKISGIMRVKNEIAFLERSISSVIDLVDELIIVDNCSDDGSAEVIADYSGRFSSKIKTFKYPHKIARYGEESTRLAATKEGRASPSFLPNYYNWCKELCAGPYILKWDGDTVATNALGPTLERFRKSRAQVLCHVGVNLHEDRASYIAGRPLEDMEPRLFFKPFSTYDHYKNCETLWSPYLWHYTYFLDFEKEPLYFHLKYCKVDRFANLSNDLQIQEAGLMERGEPLPDYLREQVVRLGL